MSNQQIAWGYDAGNLLTSGRINCQSVSTKRLYMPLTDTHTSGKPGVFRIITSSFPGFFTQAESLYSYLLNQVSLHISTRPITTTKKKGFKK
jgi:hypothetical protein